MRAARSKIQPETPGWVGSCGARPLHSRPTCVNWSRHRQRRQGIGITGMHDRCSLRLAGGAKQPRTRMQPRMGGRAAIQRHRWRRKHAACALRSLRGEGNHRGVFTYIGGSSVDVVVTIVLVLSEAVDVARRTGAKAIWQRAQPLCSAGHQRAVEQQHAAGRTRVGTRSIIVKYGCCYRHTSAPQRR